MRISMRAPGAAVATGITALLTVVALTGCGSLSSSSGAGASSPVTSTAPGTSSPAPASHAATITPPPTATSPASTPAGGPVPSGFAATSVTFVSADEAFVLGTAPCAVKPCTSIARTLNRGATWVGLPAPVVPLGTAYNTSASQAAAWGIRFASPEQGFVFGNGLWETTDGGEHWAAAAGPGGPILDLEVIDGQVLALTSGALYRQPLAGGSWSLVTRVSNASVIATQARVAAVLDGSKVIVTGNGGLSISAEATPCTTLGVAEPSSVAVTGPDSLALLCAGGAAMGSVQKTVYVSDDLGAQWTKAGSPPMGGDPAGLSAGTPGQIVVSAESGASELYYSADGGGQWSTAWSAGDGGMGFNDLGFTTTSDGVVVRGPAISDGNGEGRPGQLLLTSDGGATWQTVTW
jgi:photosystem II stability/assembly factor-like uncharacterized protein